MAAARWRRFLIAWVSDIFCGSTWLLTVARAFRTMSDLIEKLSAIVNPDRVSVEPAVLDDLSWDALSQGRIHPERKPLPVAPLCAVWPVSTEEVRKIVLLANTEKVPLVPFGGGSGLMGGALSLRRGLVIDLRRMDQVLAIDPDARTVHVQAGIVLEALDKNLQRAGLMLGHDPWTLPVATVGGAISTNSLGYRGGKYGSMGDQVLGLEAVLPSGAVVRTRAVPKLSTGIGLKYLFIGGEGCFGIITEATVRVFSLPQRRVLYAFRFSSFESGFGAVQDMFAQGLRPALLDFGDSPAKFGDASMLYLGLEGATEFVEAEERVVTSLCDRRGGVALPRDDAERFWEQRHVIAQRFMRNRRQRRELSPDPIRRDWVHVALPASRVLEYRKKAVEILARHGVRIRESGIWTQPELFSMSLVIENPQVEKSQRALQEAVDEVLRLAQKMGGSMEYCHGVGVKLAPFMDDEHGYGLEVMRGIKKLLDPNEIMNPGKLAL